MLDELIRLLREADSYAAVQHLQGASGEGALEVAERFDAAVRGLYWDRKDVSAVVTVARAGILYCLGKRAEADTQEIADQLAGKAKVLAANMASFTWPGWAEPGCSPSRADKEAGLDAARLNLRLAEELGRPPERIEDAHWLLGAQLIAAGEPELALEEFLLSNSETRPLFHGYTLLTLVLLGRQGAKEGFDALLAGFRAEGDEASRFSADQLTIAYEVFVRRA
jgi:hypothetical protein